MWHHPQFGKRRATRTTRLIRQAGYCNLRVNVRTLPANDSRGRDRAPIQNSDPAATRPADQLQRYAKPEHCRRPPQSGGPDSGRSMRCAGGLIPSCAKDEKIGYSAINARAETVDTVASFCGAFKKRRCLIPADGFYEWKKVTVLQTPKTEPSFVARSSSLRPRLA